MQKIDRQTLISEDPVGIKFGEIDPELADLEEENEKQAEYSSNLEKQKDITKSIAPEDNSYPTNPHSEELYSWIDDQILRAGLQIGGQQPYGTKIVGRGIELQLYRSLDDMINAFLKELTGTEAREEVILKLKDVIQKWYDTNIPAADKAFEELFTRGFSAGVVSTGKMGTFDEQAMNVIRQGKYRIGNRIRLFGDDTIKSFAGVITEAYTPEGIFSLQSLADKMQEIIPAQRYQLERIARTEVNQVSTVGRIYGWLSDDDKYFFQYFWNHAADDKVRKMKRWRSERNPWSFKEIVFLFTHNEQLIDNRWELGSVNCRCTISRAPIEEENTQYRLSSIEGQFRRTFDFDIVVP